MIESKLLNAQALAERMLTLEKEAHARQMERIDRVYESNPEYRPGPPTDESLTTLLAGERAAFMKVYRILQGREP